jgi:hypothetical protein
MATMQKRPGRLRRFFGWFARHKITTIFIVLVLGVGVYAAGSWLSWNAQVEDEKVRFMQMDERLTDLSKLSSTVDTPNVNVKRNCSYRGSEAFGQRWLSCKVEVSIVYNELTRSQAQSNTDVIKAALESNGLILAAHKPSDEFYETADYSFLYKDMDCSYESQFYEAEVPSYARYGDVSPSGDAAILSIRCGADTKAYFPITRN